MSEKVNIIWMETIKLSVVIPAYNEEKNLAKGVLDQVQNYLKSQDFLSEVIVVDDGSTDKTKEIVREYTKKNPGLSLLENTHGGKAIAVMSGMMASKGKIVLFTDMDQATPIEHIEKFFPDFDQGVDIVIGSRSGRKGAPMVRKVISWGFSFLRNIILGLPYSDTQCGFKAFSRASIEKIIPKIIDEWGILHTSGGAVNAGFDVELLYIAKKYDYKITEVPVVWNYVDTERVQVVKDALAAIYDMLRIRFNDLIGKYN